MHAAPRVTVPSHARPCAMLASAGPMRLSPPVHGKRMRAQPAARHAWLAGTAPFPRCHHHMHMARALLWFTMVHVNCQAGTWPHARSVSYTCLCFSSRPHPQKHPERIGAFRVCACQAGDLCAARTKTTSKSPVGAPRARTYMLPVQKTSCQPHVPSCGRRPTRACLCRKPCTSPLGTGCRPPGASIRPPASGARAVRVPPSLGAAHVHQRACDASPRPHSPHPSPFNVRPPLPASPKPASHRSGFLGLDPCPGA